MQIDLHGLRVGEAVARVAKTIEVMRNAAVAQNKKLRGTSGNGQGRLTIVTGRGVHSAAAGRE